MTAYKALKWPVLAFVALTVGICTGYAAKGIQSDMKAASIEGLCRPSKSWAAYVATEIDGYVCIKEQIHTKRLIKYIIVEKDFD